MAVTAAAVVVHCGRGVSATTRSPQPLAFVSPKGPSHGAAAAWAKTIHGTSLKPTRRAARTWSPMQQSRLVLRSSVDSATTDASSSSAAAAAAAAAATRKIPIYLLAGFLGAGKTSVLKHVLENTDGRYRLGVIVNDVAAVNIDAKLVKQSNQQSSSFNLSTTADIVELQNGCACCSLADELFTSLERLLASRSASASVSTETLPPPLPFDAILVELSGVADPVAIQNNWQQAVSSSWNTKVTNATHMARVVTIVDATTFGTDYMTWDTVTDRPTWMQSDNEGSMDCTVHRKVVELLTEQVEAAHVIVVNKQDLVSPEQLSVVKSMVQSLNDKPPVVITTSFGRVNVTQLLDHWSEEDAASVRTTTEADVEQESTKCAAPDCTDPSHDHAHDNHNHHVDSTTTTAAVDDCLDAQCNDPTHSHSHHHHEHAAADDATNSAEALSSSSSTTSTDNLGIGNFVYKATRPFCAERLMELLYAWPVPVKDELDLTLLRQAAQEGYSMRDDNDEKSPFVGVLRSKGFLWMAPVAWIQQSNEKEIMEDDSWRHDTAMYWSHAGRHLGITEAGRWWSSIGSIETMKQFFGHDPAEYDRVLREDFVSAEFGDRRQELVFIGVALQQEAICNALNACLLTELEMERYRSQVQAIVEVPSVLDAA
jgi:G3E family GTPase